MTYSLGNQSREKLRPNEVADIVASVTRLNKGAKMTYYTGRPGGLPIELSNKMYSLYLKGKIIIVQKVRHELSRSNTDKVYDWIAIKV